MSNDETTIDSGTNSTTYTVGHRINQVYATTGRPIYYDAVEPSSSAPPEEEEVHVEIEEPVAVPEPTTRRRRENAASKKQHGPEQTHKRNLRDAQKQFNLKDLYIGPNDIFIMLGQGNYPRVMISELNKTLKVRDLLKLNIPGSDYSMLSKGLYFDKNGNNIGLSFRKNSRHVDFQLQGIPLVSRRIRGNESGMISLPHSTYGNRYLIINKQKFIDSRGENFAIRGKMGIEYNSILRVKKKLIKRFKTQEEFLQRKKVLVSSVFDEDKYEIFYHQDFMSDRPLVTFFFRFDDLVIKNSIEQEHDIECLITKLEACHIVDGSVERELMIISRGMKGLRLKFSPVDARFRYEHSHLSRSTFGTFGSFCMGSEHFLSGIGRTVSDLEFEGILYGMYDHVSWESLEGGPYHKMEEIGRVNNRTQQISHNHMSFNAYDPSVNAEIVKLVQGFDLSSLSSAFKLIPNEKGDVYYQVDEHEFYDKFTSLFDKNWVIQMNHKNGYSGYAYLPSEKRFIIKDENDYYDENGWEKLVIKAKHSIEKVPSIYMNGEFIEPEIVKTERVVEIDADNQRPCICPGNIVVFMKFFHDQFLKRLKNEQTK